MACANGVSTILGSGFAKTEETAVLRASSGRSSDSRGARPEASLKRGFPNRSSVPDVASFPLLPLRASSGFPPDSLFRSLRKRSHSTTSTGCLQAGQGAGQPPFASLADLQRIARLAKFANGQNAKPTRPYRGDSRVEQGWAKDEERSEALVGLVNDADGVEVEARRAPREVRVVANIPKGIDRAAIADNVDDADVGDAL